MANLDTAAKRNAAFLDLWGSIQPSGAINEAGRWAISEMYLPGGNPTPPPPSGGGNDIIYVGGAPGFRIGSQYVGFRKECATWICKSWIYRLVTTKRGSTSAPCPTLRRVTISRSLPSSTSG